MSWTVATYLCYLVLAVPLTVWVATTLSRNGRVFLADVFSGDDALAEAVNRLLVVGFYLLNLGVVTLYLRVGRSVDSAQGLFDVLSVKIGLVLLLLGVVHLVNVLVFSSMRRHSRAERRRPQAPQAGPWAPAPPTPYAGPARS